MYIHKCELNNITEITYHSNSVCGSGRQVVETSTRTCHESTQVIEDRGLRSRLLRFCQDTRLQYNNSHILLGNRFILKQQHVDCKILTRSWKRELRTMQMDRILLVIRLVRPGHTWSSTYLWKVALVWLLMILLRMMFFILLHHVLWLDLEPFLRNVRVCGCPRMTSRTHPHGPRPR